MLSERTFVLPHGFAESVTVVKGMWGIYASSFTCRVLVAAYRFYSVNGKRKKDDLGKMDDKHPKWKEILLQQQQQYMQFVKFWQSPGAREPAGMSYI